MFPTIATSLISGLFGMGNQNQMIQQQKKENELSFQRNMQLAQQQNAMNIAQWNRANEYNTPLNQIKRLKEAGLSPSLMYKGGASFGSSPSPTLTAGTPLQPADVTLGGQRKTIGDIFNQSFQNALLGAQTRKENATAKGQEITNETLFAQNSAQLEKTLSEIGVNNETIIKIKADVQAIYEQFDVWTAQIDKLRADIANDTERVAIQKLEYEINKKLADQNIKESLSRIGLNDAQIKSITQKLPLELVNLAKQGELTQAQINESVSRWMLNILEQDKVIAETDKILLENAILTPDAMIAEWKTEDMKGKIGDFKIGKYIYYYSHLFSQVIQTFSGIISKL